MMATPVPVQLTVPVLRAYASSALLKGVIRAGGTKKSTRRITSCRVTSNTAGQCYFWVHMPRTKDGWPANTCAGTVFIVAVNNKKAHFRLESDYCG